MAISVGLPSQVISNWNEYGLAGATALVQRQVYGADTSDALEYYSSILVALQSIGSQTITIPAFGATPTVAYAYGLATRPALAVKATVSLWTYGNAVLPPIAAVGGLGVLYGRASLPALRVLH